MLGVDELHGVGAVAVQAQQVRAQGVGRGVQQPGAQDPVAQHGSQGGIGAVDRATGTGVDLTAQVVVAARGGQHDLGPPGDGLGQGLVGRGVAGVEREHHVGGLVGAPVPGGGHDEPHPGLPDPLDQRGVAGDDVVADVHPDGLDRAPTAEPAVGGQGQVGVAAAEVDHAQGPVGRLVGDHVVEPAEERVDLAPLGRPRADGVEQRVVRGEPVLLDPVVAGHGVARRPARGVGAGGVEGGGAVDLGLPALGHPQLQRPAGVLHVPVAERLLQQGVHGLGERVVGQGAGDGGARVPLRHHHPSAGRDGEGPQLHARHVRLGTLAATGRDGAQQVRPQQQAADLGEGDREGLGHQAACRCTASRGVASSCSLGREAVS